MTFLKLLATIRHNIDKIFINQQYEKVNFSVDVSKPGFGDITCNAAFLLARYLKQNPYDIAKTIASLYTVNPNSEIKSVVAHPSGNINFEINQGESIGRTSYINVSVIKEQGEVIKTSISGKCVLVSEGTFYI